MDLFDSGELLFHGGFNGVSLTPAEDPRSIVGRDTTFSEMGDWENTVKNSDFLGRFFFEYEGGTPNERHIKIVNDPAGSDRSVLEFMLRKAVQMNKGRVQISVYDNRGLDEISFKVKMYFHPDMKLLETYPQRILWTTLAEFWNEPFWEHSGFPFRMTLSLIKDEGVGNELRFRLASQILARGMHDLWEDENRSFTIPYGEWMTFEYYYKQGNLHNGRLVVTVTTADNVKHELFDIHNWTMHPCNPNPKGLTHFNPVKLYTSEELIDHVTNNGGTMRIYWDELELRKH